jgi:hypothetical protein
MAPYSTYKAFDQEFPTKGTHFMSALLHILEKEAYAVRHEFGKRAPN